MPDVASSSSGGGLPRYTSWAAVPDGLFTRTQLGEQGRKPAGEPVGRVLYHGNKYAELYPLEASVAKRPCSPAQRAALARAWELRFVCRRCGRREDEPLGKGRLCDGCGTAVELWRHHLDARHEARELVADGSVVLLVVADTDPPSSRQGWGGPPASVAVLRLVDGAVEYAAAAGAEGSRERLAVVDALDALLDGRRLAVEGDYHAPSTRSRLRLLLDPPYGVSRELVEAHPWAAECRASVESVWRRWYGWTIHRTSRIPGVPEELVGGWPRSADAAADGRALVELLHQVAGGTAEVWEKAVWRDGWELPEEVG